MSESNGSEDRTLWDAIPEKKCGHCKEVKTINEFGKVKGKHRSYCRACHADLNNRPDLRTEKRCPQCKEIKAIAEFSKSGKRYQSYCRPCSWVASAVLKEKYKKSGKAAILWRGYYEDKRRWVKMLSKHGLTRDQYVEMEREQDGLCAICRQPETDQFRGTTLHLAVDHDHETKKVRGLLCRSCNLAIGKFRDDPEIIEAALNYLRLHKK